MSEDGDSIKINSVKDAKLFVETAESRKVASVIINNTLTITNTSLLNSTNPNTEAANTEYPISQSSPSSDTTTNDIMSVSSPSIDIVATNSITESLPPVDRVENDSNTTPPSVLTTTEVIAHGDQNNVGEPVLCQPITNALVTTPDENDDEKYDGNDDINVDDTHVSGEKVENVGNAGNGADGVNVSANAGNVVSENVDDINNLLNDSV